jgi:hypothetical protein
VAGLGQLLYSANLTNAPPHTVNHQIHHLQGGELTPYPNGSPPNSDLGSTKAKRCPVSSTAQGSLGRFCPNCFIRPGLPGPRPLPCQSPDFVRFGLTEFAKSPPSRTTLRTLPQRGQAKLRHMYTHIPDSVSPESVGQKVRTISRDRTRYLNNGEDVRIVW